MTVTLSELHVSESEIDCVPQSVSLASKQGRDDVSYHNPYEKFVLFLFYSLKCFKLIIWFAILFSFFFVDVPDTQRKIDVSTKIALANEGESQIITHYWEMENTWKACLRLG